MTTSELRAVQGVDYDRAKDIIWAPDMYELPAVAFAAEIVLCTEGAQSRDVHQASYLITTMRPR